MQTIDKSAQVLKSFTAAQPEWGVRDLAAHLSFTRSSTHEYLQALTQAGFLRRSTQGRYRLSWKLLELSGPLWQALPWLPAARLELARLASTTKSLAFLCVLEEVRVVCIDRSLGDPEADLQEVQTDVHLPANATAAGKVLYAHANLPTPHFEQFTPSTITTIDEWSTELARVRADGFAHAVEEWTVGQCALAVPIFHEHALAATIGLQIPLTRYERQRSALRHVLTAAGRELSHTRRPPSSFH